METIVYESYFNIYTEKPVTSTWQYEDESGQWTSYDEDTNSKIEKAYKPLQLIEILHPYLLSH
jgi:hypothetical protein